MSTVTGEVRSTEGNRRLTALSGMVLFLLLAALGITILRVHALLTAHMFLGLVLCGPLAVKLGSTGYRFVRYYTGDADYGRAGPPRPLLRLLAPVLIVLTLTVFGSGIALGAAGPSGRSGLLFVHKASFILWFGVTAIHVLAYLERALNWSFLDLRGRGPAAVLRTRPTRGAIVAASIALGVVVAAAALWGLGWAHTWAHWAAGRQDG